MNTSETSISGKFYIYVDGKRTPNGPFDSLQEAKKHIETIRRFALDMSTVNTKYKEAIDLLEKTEIVYE